MTAARQLSPISPHVNETIYLLDLDLTALNPFLHYPNLLNVPLLNLIAASLQNLDTNVHVYIHTHRVLCSFVTSIEIYMKARKYMPQHCLNIEESLTSSIEENLKKYFPIAGVSTPDDLENKEMKPGDFYTLYTKPFIQNFIRTAKDSKLNFSDVAHESKILDLARTLLAKEKIKLRKKGVNFLENFLTSPKMLTKDAQIIQVAEEALKKYPNQKITLKVVDDVRAVCESALKIQTLKGKVNLEAWHIEVKKQELTQYSKLKPFTLSMTRDEAIPTLVASGITCVTTGFLSCFTTLPPKQKLLLTVGLTTCVCCIGLCKHCSHSMDNYFHQVSHPQLSGYTYDKKFLTYSSVADSKLKTTVKSHSVFRATASGQKKSNEQAEALPPTVRRRIGYAEL